MHRATADRAAIDRTATLHRLFATATALALTPPSGDRGTVTPAGPMDAAALPDVPAPVVTWLSRLALLYGLPFEYIVPDARMLPRESLRFFYVDPNWLSRLIDGAVSVGLGSSADSIQTLAAFEALVEKAIHRTAEVRASLRGRADAAPAETESGGTSGPITGLLLRSAVVSGWPGMEVAAYADAEATRPLPLLRFERLSPDVMIALFDGLPRTVRMLQPPEGLHFGLRPSTGSPTGWMSFLRGLGHGGHEPGTQIPDQEAPVALRGGTSRPGVLDVAASAASLHDAMRRLGALDQAGTFTAAEFAVQMVRAAGMQSFQWNAAGPAGSAG